jgi:hypothetical protein
MMKGRTTRRIAATVGISAAILAGALTACGSEKETPTPSTETTTTTPSVSPTEKSINPTGGNLFTPSVKAPPAPTAIPGDN